MTEEAMLEWLTYSTDMRGVDVLTYRTPTSHETILHVAVDRDFARAVRCLVATYPGIVDVQDVYGTTALMHAIVKRCDMDIVHTLVHATTDWAIKCHDGYSAMYLAAEQSRLDVSRCILPELPDEGAHDLFTAIAENDSDILRHLLAAGVSPSLKRPDVLQTPALHSAIHNPTLLAILLDIDPSLVDGKDRQGQTALAVASTLGELDAIHLLLQHNASVDMRDHRGRSPLHLAAHHEQLQVMQCLLGHRSTSVDIKDDDQRTPLHLAAEKGFVRGCHVLCNAKAKLHATDMHGWSPLHIAASLGHLDVCAYFVDHGGLVLDWNDSVLCRHPSSPASWVAVSPNKLCLIYAELWDVGVPSTKAKYGTLRIRDFEMNTLLHVAATYAAGVDTEYLLTTLQRHISVHSLNCHRASPLQTGNTKSLGLLQSMGSRDDQAAVGSCLPLGTASSNDSIDLDINDGPFSACSSTKLVMLLHEVTVGYAALGEATTICISAENGDTILHAVLESIKHLPDDVQETMLSGPHWLGSTAPDLSLLLDRRNWAGRTPLHVAAAAGALGACRALVTHGASLAVGVGRPDGRLKFPSSQSVEGWTALNFAVDLGHDALIMFVLNQPVARGIFPTVSGAMEHLKAAVAAKRPRLLPRVHQRLRVCDDAADGTTLPVDPITITAKQRSEQFLKHRDDPSAWSVFRAVVQCERHGVSALKMVECRDLIVKSTGDSLLHILACHADRWAEVTYLLTQEKIPVDIPNHQGKTALHYACEHRALPMVSLLVSHGANLRASHRAVRLPPVSSHFDVLAGQRVVNSSRVSVSQTADEDKGSSTSGLTESNHGTTDSSSTNTRPSEQLQTPLHVCLSQSVADAVHRREIHGIVELLLHHPASIAEPTSTPTNKGDGAAEPPTWNAFVFERVLADFPPLLPLYLDHFMTISSWYGATTISYSEVKDLCRNVDRLTHIPALMLHPTIRNALQARWRLYGRRLYRKELVLSVALVLSFTLSNYTVLTPQDDDGNMTSFSPWFDFVTPDDAVVGTFKLLTWALALYHLVYVELWQELRLQRHRYWRSVWNYINLATYFLLLMSLPLEYASVRPAITESCLSLASILLLFGLMQSLLVYPTFSVLLFSFSRMVRVAVKFCCLHLLLLVGFTAAFYLIFHGKSGHESLAKSFASVFFITFGEIQFHENYADVPSPVRYSFGLIVLIAYLVCVNVVGLNMLVAMMTSEYEQIKSQAEELAMLQLASTMHRYETWLGRRALEKLYDESVFGDMCAAVADGPNEHPLVKHPSSRAIKSDDGHAADTMLHDPTSKDIAVERSMVELTQRVTELESLVQQHVQANHMLLQELVGLLQRSSSAAR
ncbi:hypothetical protein H310_12565 [Aphanomyces invadans]|uniref:Ion transport domain-containing protein n=1 Tax=Aphanomyces invadans TaxID=157072 RepID=A0A024THR7_9STRA|nr:hypothetical protein H310_12565 [Aphanomyces invadans]ETV93529.1 hypothetical protein H310_12565 [Aphanomyces invadans]|eukprot:XP_008877871.1 hypothetical protein H310_12565 [Aphanomyces invadans]